MEQKLSTHGMPRLHREQASSPHGRDIVFTGKKPHLHREQASPPQGTNIVYTGKKHRLHMEHAPSTWNKPRQTHRVYLGNKDIASKEQI